MEKIILGVSFLFLSFWGLNQQNMNSNNSCFTEIPQVITINDLDNLLVLNGNCTFSSFSFQLYNRWGQLVRESKNATNPLVWERTEIKTKKTRKNRKQNNAEPTQELLPEGQYYILITYVNEAQGITEKITKHITVINSN